MTQSDLLRVPAAFIRGGTSKGVFFHGRDLPEDKAARDALFLQVIGSPDPYMRQLNGMGGGISSLSKAVIIDLSTRDDADIDYTIVQLAIDQPIADYEQACGNLSASVGPFAVDEGLIEVTDGETLVRVYNTNTQQIYHARFAIKDGLAVETGNFEMSGVSGTGAKIRLDYLDPGGAKTAAFLPTEAVTDTVHIPGYNPLTVSMVDATNPAVFVNAQDVGKTATESPQGLQSDAAFMRTMDQIRRQAGVTMGMAESPEAVPLSNPKVAIVAAPADYLTLRGATILATDYDIAIRIVSMEQVHRAVTGTGAMGLASACQVTGSITAQLANDVKKGADIRIGSPSGIVRVAAETHLDNYGKWQVDRVTVYRTQRRLMEGWVRLPR